MGDGGFLASRSVPVRVGNIFMDEIWWDFPFKSNEKKGPPLGLFTVFFGGMKSYSIIWTSMIKA